MGILITVICLVWSWCIWEALNTPTMPDEYDNMMPTRRNTQEAPSTNEKSPPSSQTYSGPTKPRHWKYATTDCLCQMKQVKIHTKDCIEIQQLANELRQVNPIRE